MAVNISLVIPAKAGIQCRHSLSVAVWIPAFAGTTDMAMRNP